MDSLYVKQLDEVIVTATRSERKLSNVAVPAQMISVKTIRQSGSVRLNDILQEQTGLFITSGSSSNSPGGGVFGNGVQIQGLSPDYTMILIDGEPVIGREGGVLDLTRIAVGDIKKIEIVKGPSSSLYGSEAMGGVVNIITQQPQKDRISAGLRYGRFNALDANLTASLKKQKWGLQVFGNRNSSNGFDLDKNIPGNTVDAFSNYTVQARSVYQLSAKTKLNLSGRYFTGSQNNFYPVTENGPGSSINVSGYSKTRDISLNPALIHQFSTGLSSSLRFYFSRYHYEQSLSKESDHSLYYYDLFQQNFFKAEDQTDWKWQKNNFLSAGGGIAADVLNTNRYNARKSDALRYLFVQNEWRAAGDLTIIAGARYDDNTAYRSRLSPKLALSYKPGNNLRINISYGSGFKAPDFRQQYLNFTNDAAGGYLIYGASEITAQQLLEQQRQGLLSSVLPSAYKISLLKPEISRGLNIDLHYEVSPRLSFSANIFRNDINNLIQYEIVAYRSNDAPVYSYFNINRAYTEGVEPQFQFLINKKIMLQGGYQFLITADKDVLKEIKAGDLYARKLNSNQVYKIKRSDYAGLPNRSAHMANLKLFYEDDKSGWSGSFRAIYRSRWGTTDKDGNGIINRSDEFASGSLMLNFSVIKKIRDLNFQAGIDNLLNYRDPLNLPDQPGIQPYISVFYSFTKNHKKEHL
ncbi:MAG: TonB-dependent receptor [Chitinophagales bacterium]|nr:TonB-dependent receptor [Chitinophagales bacterium]